MNGERYTLGWARPGSRFLHPLTLFRLNNPFIPLLQKAQGPQVLKAFLYVKEQEKGLS
jgi:hypothetical protein